MKKIPTLFEREFENHNVVNIKNVVTDGMEWVLKGEGEARFKWDGSCCAIINGKFYRRYDAKRGRKAPQNAIPCCAPDPITGHWPHWVPVDENNPADKWYVVARHNKVCDFNLSIDPNRSVSDYDTNLPDGTYEAVGPQFQNNPHRLDYNTLKSHEMDSELLDFPKGPTTFEFIREYLKGHEIEGIVFWKNNEPQCKIKRRDFGFEWPLKAK